jgi:hypothetical protein
MADTVKTSNRCLGLINEKEFRGKMTVASKSWRRGPALELHTFALFFHVAARSSIMFTHTPTMTEWLVWNAVLLRRRP